MSAPLVDPTIPEPQDPPDDQKTPDWYAKELDKTRKEAAGYRTKLRTTEEKLASAKSQEDYEKLRTDLTAENAKLARDLLIAKVGKDLPEDLAALLKGDTEDELKKHAEVLKKYVPSTTPPGKTPPPNLGGGLTGGGKPDNFDVKETARLARLGQL